MRRIELGISAIITAIAVGLTFHNLSTAKRSHYFQLTRSEFLSDDEIGKYVKQKIMKYKTTASSSSLCLCFISKRP
jgi:hypothetical protein